jgi:hypothetical protein
MIADFLSGFFGFFFFCTTGIWTQGFILARQALFALVILEIRSHSLLREAWTMIPQFHASWHHWNGRNEPPHPAIGWDGVLQNCLPGWHRTAILPISASQVARILGVIPRSCPWLAFLKLCNNLQLFLFISHFKPKSPSTYLHREDLSVWSAHKTRITCSHHGTAILGQHPALPRRAWEAHWPHHWAVGEHRPLPCLKDVPLFVYKREHEVCSAVRNGVLNSTVLITWF